MRSFVVAAAIALLLILLMLGAYNRFAYCRKRVQRSWRDVDAELQRRHDIVPAFVNAVRQHAASEREAVDTATSLQLTAMAVQRAADAQALAEQALGQGLQQLIALGARYPELRTSTEFLGLEQQLIEIEDRIQDVSRVYNAHVRRFNALVKRFPSLVIARMFGFTPEPYFELQPAVGHVPAPSVDLTPWV